jgi:hypothetical protein
MGLGSKNIKDDPVVAVVVVVDVVVVCVTSQGPDDEPMSSKHVAQ